MLKRYTVAFVFVVLGVTLFMILWSIRPMIVGELDSQLWDLTNGTSPNIYHDNAPKLHTFYDATTWFFLIAPFLYLLFTIIRKEQEIDQYGYTQGGYY